MAREENLHAMRHRSFVRAAVGLALMATLLPAGAARAGVLATQNAACAKSAATTFYTFKIDAKSHKKVYRPGEVAKILMKVSRPGEYDPVGGTTPLPPTVDIPAADVEINVSMWAGNYYMYGTSVTDENGEGTVKVRLHPRSPAGPVRVDVSARSYYNRGGCPDLEEAGFRTYDPMFKIIR